MVLRIQDPKYPTSPSLHESILDSSKTAIRGGGAFSFVSKVGVDLLLKDELFMDFMKGGVFDLIVGIDDITNVRALETLHTLSQEVHNLKVRVFHHDFSGATFHPKFCWFRLRRGGILVAGSGNLTGRGLRGNWEAFTISVLTPNEINELEQQWTDWVQAHLGWLKSPDDQAVLERAKLNIPKKRIRPVVEPETIEVEEEVSDVDDISSDTPQLSDPVLIAEIPRGGNRWNQANFDLETFRNFFEVQEGITQRILLQHVNDDGTLGNLESRPSVSVRSQNYRFELQAAAGLDYPDQGRPIAIFLRIATRSFRYKLLMPNDPGHSNMVAFLDDNWDGRGDRLRRIVTNIEALQTYWAASPLL